MAKLDCQVNVNSEVVDYYPPGSEPEVRFNEVNTACSQPVTPRRMTGFLVQMIRQHFSDTNNISVVSTRNLLAKLGVWQLETEKSGILIDSVGNWDPSTQEKRPAVLAKAGDWLWHRSHNGDISHVEPMTGERHYFGFFRGTHAVMCMGNSVGEAEKISEEVAGLLLNFGPDIVAGLNLNKFIVMQLGSVKAVKESTENYAVPIDIGYIVEYRWKLVPDAPRIKQIKLDFDGDIPSRQCNQ